MHVDWGMQKEVPMLDPRGSVLHRGDVRLGRSLFSPRVQLFPHHQPFTMSVSVTPEQLSALKATLLNSSGNTPLHERFRALFMLKAVGGDEVVQIVSEGQSTFSYSSDPQDSKTPHRCSSTSSPTSLVSFATTRRFQPSKVCWSMRKGNTAPWSDTKPPKRSGHCRARAVCRY